MEKHEPWPMAVRKFFSAPHDNNPYATTETMRSYDQILRNAVADRISHVAAFWRQKAQELGQNIPLPTRDNPFPSTQQINAAKHVRAIAGNLSQWASQIAALEVPAQDRVHHRVQNAPLLLDTLLAVDLALINSVNELEQAREVADITANLQAFEKCLRDREQLLRDIP